MVRNRDNQSAGYVVVYGNFFSSKTTWVEKFSPKLIPKLRINIVWFIVKGIYSP